MKLTCLVLMLALSVHIFGQQTTPVVNTDYLKKSKKQKTVAWVLLIGGTVLTTIGVGVALSGGLDCAFGDPTCNNNQTLADILSISGSAAVLGSIPLFIAAGRNKRKAVTVSFKNEKSLQVQNYSLAYQPLPSLTLKISL
jgi:Na+/H+ antiporter NhaA